MANYGNCSYLTRLSVHHKIKWLDYLAFRWQTLSVSFHLPITFCRYLHRRFSYLHKMLGPFYPIDRVSIVSSAPYSHDDPIADVPNIDNCVFACVWLLLRKYYK